MQTARPIWLLLAATVAIYGLVACPAACAKDHRTDDFGDHLEHLIEHVLPDPPPKTPPAAPPTVVSPPPAPPQALTPPPPPVEGPVVIDNVGGYASDPETGRLVIITPSGFIQEINVGTRGVIINWATGIEAPPDIIHRPPRPPRPPGGTSGGGSGGGPGGGSAMGGSGGSSGG